MVEFASGVREIALNLESENVRIVVFGSYTPVKDGDFVKCIVSIVDVLRESLYYSNSITPPPLPLICTPTHMQHNHHRTLRMCLVRREHSSDGTGVSRITE
ncbi:hypothetical protein R6Q59_009501 [Mikania micrantha]